MAWPDSAGPGRSAPVSSPCVWRTRSRRQWCARRSMGGRGPQPPGWRPRHGLVGQRRDPAWRALEVIKRRGVLDHAICRAHVAVGPACNSFHDSSPCTRMGALLGAVLVAEGAPARGQGHVGVAQVVIGPMLMVTVWMPLAPMTREILVCRRRLHVDLWEAAASSRQAGGSGMALPEGSVALDGRRQGSRRHRCLSSTASKTPRPARARWRPAWGLHDGRRHRHPRSDHVEVAQVVRWPRIMVSVWMPLAPMTREIWVCRRPNWS